MSVLLDEETVVLDGLDFEVPCERGEHQAEAFMKCRQCEHGVLLCADHLAAQRKKIEDTLATPGVRGIECRGCGLRSHSFDGAIVVITL